MNEKDEVKYDKQEYVSIENLKAKENTIINNNSSSPSLLAKFKNNNWIKKFTCIKNFKAVAIVACFAIVVLLVLSYSSTSNTSVATSNISQVDYVSSTQYVNNLEDKLTSLLSSIKGAGKTKVMVTLESGAEIKIANSVEEKTTTTSSGTTVTVVTNPIIIEQNGEDKPLVVMEVVPKIKGVIVVSEGATQAKVKMDMYTAIKALLDIPSSSIEIFAGI